MCFVGLGTDHVIANVRIRRALFHVLKSVSGGTTLGTPSLLKTVSFRHLLSRHVLGSNNSKSPQEEVIADPAYEQMYFIPLAIFLGAPEPLTVRYYIWKSMIPSFLGNAVGGGLFVGVVYWYLFLAGTEVEIHFDTMPTDTAGQKNPIITLTFTYQLDEICY
jgi:formate/nitrite transporter FocA (FNT family)